MVDLRAKPYRLSGGDAAWVRAAIASMTDEEKVGQLLFCAAPGQNPQELVERYHIGGFHCAGLPSRQAREISHALQTASPIPLFLACGTDRGGSGAATDGTYIATGRKIAATGRPQYARELGFLANEEAAAMGFNMAFAPVCGLRPGGDSPESLRRITSLGAAYTAGVHDLPGFASVCRCVFSGDGGGFTQEGWLSSCGQAYRAILNAGVDGILTGGADAGVAALLRAGLGFQGVVICDTTPMTGPDRGKLLAAAVNGGGDMLLCPGNLETDFSALLDACRSGAIRWDRLNDALTRILGLKARMGLNQRPREELVPSAAALAAILGAPKYKAAAEAITRDALTLARCRRPGLLPLTPEKHPRVLLMDAPEPDAALHPNADTELSPAELLCGLLRDKGFDAFLPGEGAQNPPPNLSLLLSSQKRFGSRGERPSPAPGVPAIGISLGAPPSPADAPGLDALIYAYDAHPLTLEILVEKLLAGPEAFTGIVPPEEPGQP